MRPWGALAVASAAILLSACGRDFVLPADRTLEVADVRVTPGVARAGVVLRVEVFVEGGQAETVTATMLEEELPGERASVGVWHFTRTTSGEEPEGTDVLVEVSASAGDESATGLGLARFDFTAPSVVSVKPDADVLLVGESTDVYLLFDEPLGEPARVTHEGTALACSRPGASLVRCRLDASPGATAGWQVLNVVAVDAAGNEATSNVESGVAFDLEPDVGVFDITATPTAAARGMTVDIAFRTSLPVSGDPAVTVAGRPAARVLASTVPGWWAFEYLVSGTELGAEPAEAAVPIEVTVAAGAKTGVGTGSVYLDFRGPAVLGVTGMPSAVDTDTDLVVDVTFDEPPSVAALAVQGRPFDCEQPTGESVRCNYRSTGTEVEGPQSVVVRALDVLGNPAVSTEDGGFAFDFTCTFDGSRVFLETRAGGDSVLVAAPGAFEPGSQVALSTTATAAPFDTVEARADGGLDPTDVTARALDRVWFSATDVAGHPCLAAPSRRRFISDFEPSAAGTPSPNRATVASYGAPYVEWTIYASEQPSPDAALLAVVDDAGVGLAVPAPAASDWVLALVDGPWAPMYGPAVWNPSDRSVMVYFLSNGQTPYFASYAQRAWSYRSLRPSGWDSGFPYVDYDHAFVWDGGRGRALFYGGTRRFVGPVDDFFILDPLWDPVLVDPRRSPGQRASTHLIFDLRFGELVLFGGWGPGPSGTGVWSSDTWLWDGAAWTRSPVVGPPGRDSGVLAYDTHRDRAVLYAGRDGSSQFSDTWEWDGGNWAEVSVVGPGQRAGHAGTFHSGWAQTVIYGGHGSAGFSDPLSDLWAFDGTTWSEVVRPTNPPPLTYGALGYNPVDGVLVLTGGWTTGAQGHDEVWELDSATRYPQLASELVVPAAVDLSAAGRLDFRVRAWSETAAGDDPAIEVRLWDGLLDRWERIGRDGGDRSQFDAWRDVSVPISGLLLQRFSQSLTRGRARVLIHLATPATPDGGATLEVDHLELVIDDY